MIKPLNDYLVLKPLAREEVTVSGIILPDTGKKEQPDSGEVIAVGPGKLKDDGSRGTMEVMIGQKVMFKKYAPDEIEIDGDTFMVIQMDDVVGIIE